VQAFVNTLHQVFPSVYTFNVPDTFNTEVMATVSPTSLDTFRANLQQAAPGSLMSTVAAEVLPVAQAAQPEAGGIVFTDDRAPIENYRPTAAGPAPTGPVGGCALDDVMGLWGQWGDEGRTKDHRQLAAGRYVVRHQGGGNAGTASSARSELPCTRARWHPAPRRLVRHRQRCGVDPRVCWRDGTLRKPVDTNRLYISERAHVDAQYRADR
jgi:hypothetical protein